MQIYLVGGAVRDELLGIEPVERDWVVVGGSAENLLQRGFVQIDNRFPVFLHPQTGDEYALARRESKVSSGHKGFRIESGPDVTLTEDLARRDLRLNAIARTADGRLIDPYGGQADIRNQTLHHITPAFVEDPLRVLRLARFYAVLGDRGFNPAPATVRLARHMVQQPEFLTLDGDRVWRETLKILNCPSPDRYFALLRNIAALDLLLPDVDWNTAQFQQLENTRRAHTKRTNSEPLLAIIASAFAGNIRQLTNAVDALSTRWPVPRETRTMLKCYIDMLGALSTLNTAHEALSICHHMDAWRRRGRFHALLQLVIDSEQNHLVRKASRLQLAYDRALRTDSAPLRAKGLTGPALGDALETVRGLRFVDGWNRDEFQNPALS